jgi:hypothetical protein
MVAAKGTKMIDWIRVNELRSEVGVEDFNEVVLLFLSSLCQIGETQAAQGQQSAIQLPEILAAFDLSRQQFVEKVDELLPV